MNYINKNQNFMKQLVLLLFVFCLGGFKFIEPPVRIFLMGDSTMADKLPQDAPETGWGQVFPELFDNHIVIKNYAVNGRSTKSFRTLGHWAKLAEQLKKGDWVFIQFGHNDQKISDTSRYAAAQTDFKQNLTLYIQEIKAKGAIPVLLTPVMRRKFDEKGKFIDQHGEYPAVVKELAQKLKVPLIDLHQKSQTVIEKHGVEGSKKIFMHFAGNIYPKFPEAKVDDTHFSPFGASLMASLIAEGIQELNIDLVKYLKKSEFENKFVYQLPKIYTPVFRKDTFNIQKYGAKADGISLNSQAIQKTIDICSQSGGGIVLIPNGLWLTGAISLKSNVNLHLEKGAILQFSDDLSHYPLIESNWEGVDAIRCQSPIYGINLENIAITGEGILDGAGDAWRPVKKSKLSEAAWKKLLTSGGFLNENKDTWYPSASALKGSTVNRPGVMKEGYNLQNSLEIKDFLRPNMLSLINCKNILLAGITFQNSPAWTLHPLLSEHITLQNVTVRNPWYAQNGDGVDLESCRNFLVENCILDTGDDGICIKSGRNEEGRKRGVPTENGIIKNCTVYHAHGGFVIGSEMSGGVRNLYVSNCNFLGTDVGLRFKTARGRGGIVEKIYVNNINMTDIVGEAILFDMYYMGKDPVAMFGDKTEIPSMEFQPLSEETPQFRDFYIQNVVCRGAEKGIFVRGLPEMNIKNIYIENSTLKSRQGMVCLEGENIHLKNVNFYPEDNTIIHLQDSKNITLDNIQFKENADLLLKINGERSKNIRLLNTNISKVKKEYELGKNLTSSIINKK
jgi:DNA sulfur modification protein DndE